MESWSIHVHKEYFKFSLGHFLIFPDGTKERLHGHNYQVDAEIEGELTERGLVIDFKLIKPIIRELCDQLDEHFLIPQFHPELHYRHREDGHTELRYRACNYLMPTEETVVLPINNSSVENLATWLGRELRDRVAQRFGRPSIRRLRLAVSETSGQWGIYRFADGAEELPPGP